MADHRSITWVRPGVRQAALRHGDNVAATARDVSALRDLRDEHPGLLALSLDVTDGR
jgi:hypothetical protein